MPSFEPGRKRGAEYHIFGAACGRDSRERESKRALFEHDPYIITGGPMAGRTAENDGETWRNIPASESISVGVSSELDPLARVFTPRARA